MTFFVGIMLLLCSRKTAKGRFCIIRSRRTGKSFTDSVK